MEEIVMVRHNLQIDPHLTIWGWEIPVYLFLGGLAAGVMILTAAMRLGHKEEELSRWARWIPFATPVALSIGMLALFIDLAHREHVYRFYLTFRPLSPMSWGAWILLAIYPATLVLGVAGFTPAEIQALSRWGPVRALHLDGLLVWLKEASTTHIRRICWTNIALGICLGAYTGLLIGTLAARPAWNSVVLAPLFLVSGLSTGAALMMLFPMKAHEHHMLRTWDVIAIISEILLLALFLMGLVSGGGEAGRQAAQLFFGGKFTTAFWTLVIFAGLATPLALEVLETRRSLRPTRMTPVLILVGGLALRWIIVLAGQTSI